ncbi:AMP-binding protein [Candidatus Omnitrophota bacterium]
MQQDLVIHNIFSQVAGKFPRQVIFQEQQGSLRKRFTYNEVENIAIRIAEFLVELGYKKGTAAVIILENSPQWGMIYLGIMYAGLTCVAVDCEATADDLINIFRDCRPVVIFTSAQIYREKIINTGLKAKRVIVDSRDFENIKAGQAGKILLPLVLPSDIASLIYTSGTTAKPKGVVLTQCNFCSNFRSIEQLNISSAKDNFISILPLHHTYAFMVTLLVPVLTGARITYAEGFKADELAGIIKQANVSILTGVPQLFSLIHRAVFEKIKNIPFCLRPFINPILRKKIRAKFGKDLRMLISGGARLEPKIGQDLSGLGFKVIEGYGLTETSPVVCFNPPQHPKFGSVGKPIPGVEIKIFRPDDNRIGEVFIKGANVMPGYFKQPELTALVKSEDGWFNSQDLGYIDEQGYLFLTGRKKDVIVLGSGKNIYPAELEEYYSQSPYIREVCVLEKINQQFGQEVKLLFAVVVPDFGYFRKKREVNIREKIRWELENLSSRLPVYKRIMGFEVDKQELPRTRLKKIKRHEIYQRFLGYDSVEKIVKPLPAAGDEVILQSEIAQKIIQYLSRQLNKSVNLGSLLELDLGIDSLGRVELGSGLESYLSLKIPQQLIDSVLTVRELIVSVEQIKAASTERLINPLQKTWGQILDSAVPVEVLNKIRINYGVLDMLLTGVFKCIFRCWFRLFFSLKISGREHIPSRGAYIFCPNHASYLDGFILFSSIPYRCAINLFFIGHAKIFEHPLIRWAIKIARLISIDPLTHLTESLQASRFVLERNKVICIFPEGARSIDANPQAFKKGVGILAKELNIPLIPVYIKGSDSAWPRTQSFPRSHPLHIIFGKPVLWQELGSDYEEIAAGLRKQVLKLKQHNG